MKEPLLHFEPHLNIETSPPESFPLTRVTWLYGIFPPTAVTSRFCFANSELSSLQVQWLGVTSARGGHSSPELAPLGGVVVFAIKVRRMRLQPFGMPRSHLHVKPIQGGPKINGQSMWPKCDQFYWYHEIEALPRSKMIQNFPHSVEWLFIGSHFIKQWSDHNYDYVPYGICMEQDHVGYH